MVKFVNRAKMTTSTTGTGTLTLVTALSGFQSFAASGVVNADIVTYVIEDGTAWEIGNGVYTSVGTTLSRSLLSSSTGSLLVLSGNAVVYVSVISQTIDDLYATKADLASPSLTGNVTVATNSASPALKVTQTGAGAAFLVEDSASTDTTPFIIDASGNVGIGTSSPGTKLDVAGTITARAVGAEGGEITFNNIGDASTGLVVDVSSADVGRIFQTRNNSTLQLGQLVGTGGIVSLYTAAAERLRIGSAGQIGIGGATYGTSGQVLASGGSGAAPSWEDAGGVNIQVFTATGTYTPTSGYKYAIGIVTGGGSSGNGSATSNVPASGGIAGNTVIGDFSISGLGAQTVTIGAGGVGVASGISDGGTSSLGAILSASGGNQTIAYTGLVQIQGGRGQNGTGTGGVGGLGGSSFWGGGGSQNSAGVAYGSGGGGEGATPSTSGSGKSGVVMIMEFK